MITNDQIEAAEFASPDHHIDCVCVEHGGDVLLRELVVSVGPE